MFTSVHLKTQDRLCEDKDQVVGILTVKLEVPKLHHCLHTNYKINNYIGNQIQGNIHIYSLNLYQSNFTDFQLNFAELQ